ncbi:hypothetical protein DW060_07835, partial [Leyella stercorea]
MFRSFHLIGYFLNVDIYIGIRLYPTIESVAALVYVTDRFSIKKYFGTDVYCSVFAIAVHVLVIRCRSHQFCLVQSVVEVYDCLFLNKVDTLKSTIMKKKEEQLQISLDRVKLQKHVYELCRVQKLTINEVRKKTGL